MYKDYVKISRETIASNLGTQSKVETVIYTQLRVEMQYKTKLKERQDGTKTEISAQMFTRMKDLNIELYDIVTIVSGTKYRIIDVQTIVNNSGYFLQKLE